MINQVIEWGSNKRREDPLLIDALQSAYGHVLKSSKKNNDKMAKGLMTTLHHYSGTEEDPQHQYYAEYEISRSKFQKEKYNRGHTNRTVKHPTPNSAKQVI